MFEPTAKGTQQIKVQNSKPQGYRDMLSAGPSNRCVHKGTKLCFFLCVCVSVCMFLMDAQTVRPIVSKLGKGIKGHLAGKLGLFSCAWVPRGLC